MAVRLDRLFDEMLKSSRASPVHEIRLQEIRYTIILESYLTTR